MLHSLENSKTAPGSLSELPRRLRIRIKEQASFFDGKLYSKCRPECTTRRFSSKSAVPVQKVPLAAIPPGFGIRFFIRFFQQSRVYQLFSTDCGAWLSHFIHIVLLAGRATLLCFPEQILALLSREP